jgi:rare lipoprotein A
MLRLKYTLMPLFVGCMLAGCAHRSHRETGKASWYGPGFRGKPTASGERFAPRKKTAAHRTLAFGTVVKVTRTDTGQSVRVVVNDRGPFVADRVVDLSKGAARRIDMLDAGVVPVELKVVGCRSRRGSCGP